MIRKLALAVVVLVAVYAVYLGARVMSERRTVADRTDALIAAADTADVTLTPRQRALLIRVEDPTFDSNHGIDFTSPGAGMTTLSQALGKRLFFDNFKPGLAKGELIVLTRFALHPMVDRQRILRAFLASAYFGRREGRAVIGFGEAARTVFGRDLAALDEREFLSLVAMLPAPRELDPLDHAAANADRVRRIERMLAGRCKPDGLRDVMLRGCA